MRCFLSGWQATNGEREKTVIDTGYIKHRCYSYTVLIELPGLKGYAFCPHMIEAYKQTLKAEPSIPIMMDSGVFSYRSFKIKMAKLGKATPKLLTEEQFIESYVDWVKKHQHLWAIYFTVDLDVCAADIYKRHKRLLKLGIKPVPVFHGDDSIDYMTRYHDLGHKLIGIGSPIWLRSNMTHRRRYLDAVFNHAAKLNLEIHGLALTAAWVMIGYPFWSTDSSSWSRVASTGCLLKFDEHRGRMTTVHVSDRGISAKQSSNSSARMTAAIKEETEALGFDFELLRTDFVERHKWNAMEMQRMTDYCTTKHRSTWNMLC